MSSFLLALQFLTVLPGPRRAGHAADDLGRAAIFFPVIGLLLGAILFLVNWLLAPFANPALASAILITILALLTRALHLDALADTFDGLGAGGGRERLLQVMDDSHTGAFGVIAIVLTTFLKIHALESMDAERWRALLAAPVLGRWSMVVIGYRSKAAKAGLGSTFIESLSTQHFVAATLIALLLTTAILRAAAFAPVTFAVAFALGCKNYFHRRLGGVTGDILGAVGELSETAVMVLLALGAK